MNGKIWKTNQTCYVASGMSHLLLSKGACKALGIINESFPAVGQYGGTILLVHSTEDLADTSGQYTPVGSSCKCPRIISAPDPPTFAHNLSRSELRQRIIAHYKASFFNRCSLQLFLPNIITSLIQNHEPIMGWAKFIKCLWLSQYHLHHAYWTSTSSTLWLIRMYPTYFNQLSPLFW